MIYCYLLVNPNSAQDDSLQIAFLFELEANDNEGPIFDKNNLSGNDWYLSKIVEPHRRR